MDNMSKRNNIKATVVTSKTRHASVVHVRVTGSANGVAVRGTVGPFFLALDPADLGIVSQMSRGRVNRASATDSEDVSYSSMGFVDSAIMNALEAHKWDAP